MAHAHLCSWLRRHRVRARRAPTAPKQLQASRPLTLNRQLSKQLETFCNLHLHTRYLARFSFAILSHHSIEQTHTANQASGHHDFSFRYEPLGPRERSTPLPIHLAHGRLLAHHHGDFENGDDPQSEQDSLPSDRHGDRRESEETVAAKSRAEETSRTREGGIRYWSMCVCFLRLKKEALVRECS